MSSRDHPGAVLVVDDDEDIRAVFGDVLDFAGYKAAMAANGEDALAQLRRSNICVVLLDMMMPVVDGWEFRRRQLADPALAQVPVVVVTGADRASEIAREIGAADFISKPPVQEQLLEIVSRYCS